MADEGKNSARMDDDAMAGAIALPGESLDDEFESLFSAFDDVSASDALVASTISAVAGSGSGSYADAGERSGSSERDASSFVAVKGGKAAEDRKQHYCLFFFIEKGKCLPYFHRNRRRQRCCTGSM